MAVGFGFLRLRLRAVAKMSTAAATRPPATKGTPERSSPSSAVRLSSRRCRSVAISWRMSATVRSDMAFHGRDRALALFDRLQGTRRQSLARRAPRQESKDRCCEQHQSDDDQHGRPKREPQIEHDGYQRENEPDRVQDDDERGNRQAAGDSERRRLLPRFALRQLEIQPRQRPHPPLSGPRLCYRSKHAADLTRARASPPSAPPRSPLPPICE